MSVLHFTYEHAMGLTPADFLRWVLVAQDISQGGIGLFPSPPSLDGDKK